MKPETVYHYIRIRLYGKDLDRLSTPTGAGILVVVTVSKQGSIIDQITFDSDDPIEL